MTSPYTPRRRSSSDHRTRPERAPPSPGYASSEFSTSSTVSAHRNPVSAVAKSFAGIFAGCFSPPDSDNSKSLGDSEEFKSSSTVSNASRAGSQRGHGSKRGTSISSYNILPAKEPGSVEFTMEEIFRVTRNFSPSFKIGQGGFGAVYRAKLLDGTVVAVKRAKKSVYEKHLGVEFQSEIQTLSRVEHLNLVKFFGYLEQEDERIIVVEYVPNGTLREHLDCIHGSVLDLAARLDIAIDVSHAITYLHMYIGRRPIEPKFELRERITARWAMKRFIEGDAISVLDPRLDQIAANTLALEKILELALQCLAPRRQSRPTMKRCAEILWSIRKDIREQLSASNFRSFSTSSQRSTSLKE
ncbi:hypothetical protein JHK82_045955 [Glycine max]|nr:hypothetical protein JHK82_045955 [Glycine max]